MAALQRFDDLVSPDGGVIRLPAALDRAAVGALRAEVAASVLHGRGPIQLDCGAVTSIDAVGLGTLLWAANAAGRAAREVRLLDAGAAVRRMLLVNGVSDRFGEGSSGAWRAGA